MLWHLRTKHTRAKEGNAFGIQKCCKYQNTHQNESANIKSSRGHNETGCYIETILVQVNHQLNFINLNLNLTCVQSSHVNTTDVKVMYKNQSE